MQALTITPKTLTQTASFEALSMSTGPRDAIVEELVLCVPKGLLLTLFRVISHRIRDMEKVLQELGRDI